MNLPKPKPEQIRQLREKHNKTRRAFVDPLPSIKENRLRDWEKGRRDCPPLAWWVMKLIWDNEDTRPDYENIRLVDIELLKAEILSEASTHVPAVVVDVERAFERYFQHFGEPV